MQQITLDIDLDENNRPSLTLTPEREQQLIIAVVQHAGGDDYDSE